MVVGLLDGYFMTESYINGPYTVCSRNNKYRKGRDMKEAEEDEKCIRHGEVRNAYTEFIEVVIKL
jgi:hypothetical protein